MERILSLSGGATKFAGILGAAHTVLNKGFKPTIILGISSGALAALPLALGLVPKAKKVGTTLTLCSFFTKSPINAKGKISWNAIGRIVTGQLSLGLQDAKRLLADVVTEKEFLRYKQDLSLPEVYVGTVNYDRGERQVFKLRDLSYYEMLDAVEASSRIPIMVQPQVIKGERYYDGGVTDHNLASYFIDSKLDMKVEELVSVFSRPKDFKVNEISTEWDKDLFSVIERTLEIMNIEISKTDERLEQSLSKERNFKLTQIFLPKIMKSVYDVDNSRLVELWNVSVDTANNTYTQSKIIT